MASEDAGDVSVGHRGSSAEQLDTSLADDHNVALTEATSEQDAGSDEENLSEDTSDSRNVSDNGTRVKIGAEAALIGLSYDFGQSKVTRVGIMSLQNSARYFLKRFPGRPVWSLFQILRKMRLLCLKTSLLLAFVYLCTRFFWKFCRNFTYSCVS
jgi:hypothetical protein